MLIQIISDWLHSNPYLVPGYELRKANALRYDITDRMTQKCRMHLVFANNEMHFWYLDPQDSWPSDLYAIGHIDNNSVVFEDIYDGYIRGPGPDANKMSPADPKFFSWFEDNIKRIVRAINVDPV